MDPFHMAYNNGTINPGNTSAPIIFTDPNYNLNVLNYVVASIAFVAPGVNIANSNSTLTAEFLEQATRQIRLVAAGLRISYTGSNFRNQGRVILAKMQGNTSFSPLGDVSPSTLLQGLS